MLADLTVRELLNKIAGKDPVPGGGSVAALNGAIASALTSMVANLTIGKKGYEEHEKVMRKVVEVADDKKEVFIFEIDRDSDAYNHVFDCFKMPKITEEEKAVRSMAIQEATKLAATVPMGVARHAYKLMEIIETVADYGNKNAVTDACVAMMCARSAVLGALMNVRINLGAIKDEEFVAQFSKEADELEKKTSEKEASLIEKVKDKL
jgi:Methenyl tetrahydrofolate cyclohydrolase